MGTALRAPTRASRGVREGVPHQGVAPGGAGPVEAQDVETTGGVVEAAKGQVEGGGAGEAAALGRTDGGDGGTEGGGGAGLDLDGGGRAPLLGGAAAGVGAGAGCLPSGSHQFIAAAASGPREPAGARRTCACRP